MHLGKRIIPMAMCLLAIDVTCATSIDEESTLAESFVEPSKIPPDLMPPGNAVGEDPAGTPGEARPSPGSPSEPQVVPPLKSESPTRNAPADYNWSESTDVMPVRDSGGRVTFPKGSNPTIVCSPLRVCDIQLQPGERVQGAPHIGDTVRWKISPAVSGEGGQAITHIIVKPTEPGIDTNLIIPTTLGTYHMRLVSSARHYVSSVTFESPETQESAWRNLHEATGAAEPASGDKDMPVVAVNRLNFNYKIKVVKGNPSFKPLRAMDDGYHTYIAMNEDLPQAEAPALIGISPTGEEQMINYRQKGNLYVLDGTVGKLALISGVGRDQQRIELTRNPCRARGWLGICWDAKE